MLSLLLPLISLLIQIQCLTVKSQPVPLNKICSDVTGNFTVNTTYAVNLDRLISSLSSLRQNHNGFYNISVGEDSD
ncbi:unnamed protein product [Arabis nemorensis]|uniref:Uncharacterized protein n=1 Tax=Arabis nemorensis TaxID=586526 RepID=A0A565C7K5_9BRAS|nr:unnamed protein product [Arabis nemorensis]